jgi:hypothetical protein
VYSAGGVRGLLTKPRQPSRTAGDGGALDPEPNVSLAKYYAAAVHDNAENYGGQCTLNVWSPYVRWSDNLSLSQIAEGGGSGSGFQGVEAGWMVYRDVTADWGPHLFIFFTTGDYVGGYNQLVKGWIQVSTIRFPNALLTPSQSGGPQQELTLRYALTGGAWWLGVGSEWIGYYPASLFAGSGIQDAASRISYYGETGDDHMPQGTKGLQMGSGSFPSATPGRAAYQRNLTVQTSADLGSLQRFSPSWTNVTNPSYYKLDPQYQNIGPWDSYCYLGGPGDTSSVASAEISSATSESGTPA